MTRKVEIQNDLMYTYFKYHGLITLDFTTISNGTKHIYKFIHGICPKESLHEVK